MKSENIKVTAPKFERDADVTINMPETFDEWATMLGEAIALDVLRGGFVIKLQAHLRAVMVKDDWHAYDMQKLATAFKPSIVGPRKDPIVKVQSVIAKMSATQKAALLTQLMEEQK